tara:strand:+ start:2437 stop:4020 length:1584 start_codon:yes stop_codon:yes gene_type:complete
MSLINDRLDSFLNRLTGLGGSKDKGSQVVVNTNRVALRQDERDAIGRHEGYAVSWLDRVANEGTLSGWYIEDLDTRRHFSEVQGLERELQVYQRMWMALWSGMRDGASLVLMVTKDPRGGRPALGTPLGDDEELLALHHFDAGEFSTQTWDSDITSPNFRKTKTWSITPAVSGDTSRGGRGLADDLQSLLGGVHWTRVLYVPGRPLTDRERHANNGLDGSVLDSVWDAMKDQRQIDQGGAVLAQEMMQSVLKVAGLEKLEESDIATALISRMQTLAQAKGLLGTLLIRADDEYTQKAVSASGFKDLKNAVRSTWSAVTRMPETIGYGATPGGLNTDGEAGRKAWDRELSLSAQRLRLKPALERLYTILMRSVSSAPTNWRLKFHDLGTLTLKERADVMNTNALTDKVNITAGVYTSEFVREHRYGTSGYAFELPPADAVKGTPTPGTSLSGPQGRHVIEVQTQVAKGGMSRAAGIANIQYTLGTSREIAEDIIADHGDAFNVEPEDVVAGKDAVAGEGSQDQPGATD